MLQLIYDRKLVRRDHLEIISESYRKLGENRTILLNRAIKKMFRYMILDKIHEVQEIGKGNTPSIVAIDKGGSIILGVPHKKRIPHKKSVVKGVSYVTRIFPLSFKHCHGVNQCEVDTILFCEGTNNDIIKWQLNVATTFQFNGEDVTFIPDAFTELRVKDKSLLIFIEYDTGSEDFRRKDNFPILHDKLVNYKRYYGSELWKDKYKYFPIILLVTEDKKRIDWFSKECRKFGLRGYGIYCDDYTNFLYNFADLVDKRS